MLFKRSRLELRKKLPAIFLPFVLLVLVIITITTLYVSNERNFHWWIDWYHRAIEVAIAYRESPAKALQLVKFSLVEERNRIYTLPLIPFILIFGESRLVYQIGLALVYLLPFGLVMGTIATRIILAPPRAVFWSTVLLTLLIPVNWIPTFMGIPDTGGALFMGLAALVYLDTLGLNKFYEPHSLGFNPTPSRERKEKSGSNVRDNWWRVVLIGCLLAVAVLLRRHFVYGCIAFLGAVSFQTLIFFGIELRHKPRLAWRNLFWHIVQIGAIAAITVAVLLTVAGEFTYRALTTDYRTLYTSWSLPLGDTVQLYAAYYGWITLLLVALGFSAAIVTRSVTLPEISFISLYGIFSLIIWLVILRYGNVFYALHITHLIVIGLSAFGWTIWLNLTRKVRNFLLSALGCYLIINSAIALTPIGKINNFRPLFSLSIPPLVRTDYTEVARLVAYLRSLTPNQQPICILGHQRLQLNSGTIRAAERILYGANSLKLNILRAPEVDSRDAYPLEVLLQAQYVVIPNPLPIYPADPTQLPVVGEWLPNKEHDVVKVAVDTFTQNWEIAQDFQRLPVQFTLENNTTVSIYQRLRPTAVTTAVKTLSIMQQQIGTKPGGQLDWMFVSQLLNNGLISKNPDDTYKIITHPSYRDRSKGVATSLLYLGSLLTQAEVTGKITFLDNPCVGVTLQLIMLDNQGNIITPVASEFSTQKSSDFKLSVSSSRPAYILFNIISYNQTNNINYCTTEINSLAVLNQK